MTSGLPSPAATIEAGGAAYRFYLGDCLPLLRALPPQAIDVVVTSPPYNLGVKYRSYRDDRPRREYLEWVTAWATEVARVLRPLGSLFLKLDGVKFTDRVPEPSEPSEVLASARQLVLETRRPKITPAAVPSATPSGGDDAVQGDNHG